MSKRWQTALIWLVGFGIIALIIFVGMRGSIERQIIEEQIVKSGVEDIDVDKYYKENSTVLDTNSVKDSLSIQTETQVTEEILQRGFKQNPITYDYDIEGEYIGNKGVESSTTTHPMYQTYYTSATGDLWTIVSINGAIIANPVSYNMESEMSVQTVISESETIIGYDSEKNEFYNTIPNESELIVKVVEKIDAATLDSLTKEKIPEL